jgi:hypothetical protein
MSTESKLPSGKKILAMAKEDKWTEIPQRMPISGRRGSIKLYRIRDKSVYLRRRLNSGEFGQGHAFHRAQAELAANEWAISAIIMYEECLKKGPPEESEDIKTEVTGLTPPPFELQQVTSF